MEFFADDDVELARPVTAPKPWVHLSSASLEAIGTKAASTSHELGSWVNRRATDVRGEPIGVVVAIYPAADTCHPGWLAINTGPLCDSVAVAPLRGASLLGGERRRRLRPSHRGHLTRSRCLRHAGTESRSRS